MVSMVDSAALERVRRAFAARGYVRSPPDRRRRPTTHRGYELRIAARSVTELKSLARDLRKLGYRPGAPFQKGRMWRIPVYGAEAVDSLLALLA